MRGRQNANPGKTSQQGDRYPTPGEMIWGKENLGPMLEYEERKKGKGAAVQVRHAGQESRESPGRKGFDWPRGSWSRSGWES